MIQVEAPPRRDCTNLYRTTPKEEQAEVLITESAELFYDGSRQGVYIEKLPLDDLRQAILEVPSFPRSVRQAGYVGRSLTFGFLPRRPAMGVNACCRSASDRKYPELASLLYNYAQVLSDVLKKWFPERYENSILALQNVREEWKIKNTIFTSIIVNQDNPLQYHYDAGNFEGTWAVMLTFKKNIQGGYLALPELNLKLECEDASLAIFNNQDELHGVTPIVKTSNDAYRYTVVFYSMEALCKCKTPQEELKLAALTRTKVEMKRAKLLK